MLSLRRPFTRINTKADVMSLPMRFGSVIPFSFICAILVNTASAQEDLDGFRLAVEASAIELEDEVITWRRYFHENPELSNREFETSAYIAAELERLGLEVRTGIAHTGVVGVLRGAKPGPVVALRSDMDGLPVTEATDVPFRSTVTTTYNGQEIGVMHACGHDSHMAIVLGAARLFAGIREQVPGTIVFVFQPAEEGAPAGEKGGAMLMLEEGVFEEVKPEAIFGIHAWSPFPSGVIGTRAGPLMASYDNFRIVVHGRQTHASRPWQGVDPIVIASQIVLGMQTIASRQIDITSAPSVISVGSIHGGIRNNIIPDQVEMLGTVRAFDTAIRDDILKRIDTTVARIAESAGTTAEIEWSYGYPVTANNVELANASIALLRDIAGEDKVIEAPLITGAEDFSYFANEVPGFYFFLGVTPADQDPTQAPANHSPLFYIDESSLITGLRGMSHLAAAYLEGDL